MSKRFQISNLHRMMLPLAAMLNLSALQAVSQTLAPPPPVPAPQNPQSKPAVPDTSKPGVTATPEAHITPDEARQLFSLVDQLLKFSSQETGLPIKSDVKRQLTTRVAVEGYLKEKFADDEDAKRMQRSEIVLKKFGLLDRDFDLKPFLLSLLTEQIEAYYDTKDKTVNLLDWVPVEEQKPALAHELTHALQDQRVNLDKWGDQTPSEVSHTSAEDSDHLAKDELDTARDAVTEGQATAVMMDNLLKPMGRSLISDPEIVDYIKGKMAGSEDSPVLARAPLLLSESLLFPYREGLSFEQDVWMDRGQNAAFAGALDRPPSSSWEIMNPREYEQGHVPSIPYLPDIHPLVDTSYRPYDIGQVGQLDVHILTNLFGGENAARELTPAWDGGIYWAGQRLNATPAEQATTRSISFFYLSVWKSAASAQSFARLYANELVRKYSGVKADKTAEASAETSEGATEQVWTTDEGPVVITRRGKQVFVAEGFDLILARKLTTLILAAQGSGPLQNADNRHDNTIPGTVQLSQTTPRKTLTSPVIHFLSNCGTIRSVVQSAARGTRQMAN